MKELQDILAAYAPVREARRTAALATVVRVDGSAYRRPGARMLVLPDGTTVGSVSGGCLESDVALRARQVVASGRAETVTYDTTDDSDIAFGVGLGCRGVVHILLEPLRPGRDDALTLPASLLQDHATGILVTVYDTEPGQESPVKIGDRLLLTTEGACVGNLALRAAARQALSEGRSAAQTLLLEGRRVSVFLEMLRPPQPLLVFGAGHDAQPLVRLAKELGWHVTVVDSRPAFADPARFPQADAVRLAPREGLPDLLPLTENTAAIVMTHNYLHDRALLASLLPSPVRYLGVLGPRRRTERLLQELRAEGQGVAEADVARLHAPIGLDIGAETPEQIALAIVAEIQAVTAGAFGGHLRDRPGPTYSPEPVNVSPPSPTPATRPPCAVSG